VSAPLPDALPGDPLPLAARWIEEATAAVRTATAMALATVDADGRPAVRMVICRGFDAAAGALVFYTDRASPKGRDLDRTKRAAALFHWERFERQVRVEGPVTHVSEVDSDRYWESRPLDARLAAVASDQSRPIASRRAFLDRIETARRAHPQPPPRPARWGGYRIWAERVELWAGQPGRAHDRAEWVRTLIPEAKGDQPGFRGGPWRGSRLMP
jgi:pyridoxamine 5'-phosphate oxidase